MSMMERPVEGLIHWLNINRRVQWWQLPSLPLQLANLSILREELRKYNFYEVPGKPTRDQFGEPTPEVIRARQPDGTWNDLDDPGMGCKGAPFARNVPLHLTRPDTKRLLDPNPREISNKLLARDTFKPAGIVNTIAAAWLQYENHNWFFHGRGDPDNAIEVPLPQGDDWPEPPLQVRRTPRLYQDQPDPPDRAPAFPNTEVHWWDASKIYGSGEERQKDIRTFKDGKIKIQDDGRLLPHKTLPGFDLTGMHENWWTGVALLHTMFTREHNAICDALMRAYPNLDDQRLYEIAWLINSALQAKIHTIEWTPTILRHPALQIAMNANWWGAFGEELRKHVGRIARSNEVFSGIIGSPTVHPGGAPFALTEEFVAVYRMHPLIPDDWKFYSSRSDQLLQEKTFTDIQGAHTREFMEQMELGDLWYSFGRASAGAVCLHNYPNTMRRFRRTEEGDLLDLATMDITRDRERGVPRYNDLREALRMPRVRSFEELTANKKWAKEIAEVYRGDIDLVDALVGQYAEVPPPGFGFSDTAFRVFIIMASQRLKSDRFYTSDFRPEVYTQVGVDWVQNTTFKDVLLRHYPELSLALEHVDLPFAPWPKVGTRPGTSLIQMEPTKQTGPLGIAERVAKDPAGAAKYVAANLVPPQSWDFLMRVYPELKEAIGEVELPYYEPKTDRK
jgi:Animal haem peroxidase